MTQDDNIDGETEAQLRQKKAGRDRAVIEHNTSFTQIRNPAGARRSKPFGHPGLHAETSGSPEPAAWAGSRITAQNSKSITWLCPVRSMTSTYHLANLNIAIENGDEVSNVEGDSTSSPRGVAGPLFDRHEVGDAR